MKTIIALTLLAAGSAFADTITLAPSNCGTTRYCTTVYTDPAGAASVAIDARTTQPGVTVHLNGVDYTSPTGNASTALLTLDLINNLTLYAAGGGSIVLNATFYGHRVLHRSGHNYWTTQWQLLDGSIVR